MNADVNGLCRKSDRVKKKNDLLMNLFSLSFILKNHTNSMKSFKIDDFQFFVRYEIHLKEFLIEYIQ